jgi:tungstate transport system ATP-binding protein
MPDATDGLSVRQAGAAAHSASLPLEARGLVFDAGGKRLIDGIDLRLEAGRRTVIMGPNGAGKSLLLRLLHGLIEPTAGKVLWQGKPADRDVRRRQAMVFQRPVLLRRSAAANMRHALRAHGVPRREAKERTRTWLANAGLSALADRAARVLSGGEQQRLALARALSLGPEVLFLDEPTASLDPASTLGIEELIQRAAAAGTKIVLVTHNLGQARRIADEVVFVYRGRIEAFDRAPAFFDAPGSAKAQAFIDGRIVL